MVRKQFYTHVYVYVHEWNHTWYNYVSVISITRHSLACVIHLIISIIRFEGENAMCIVSLSLLHHGELCYSSGKETAVAS